MIGGPIGWPIGGIIVGGTPVDGDYSSAGVGAFSAVGAAFANAALTAAGVATVSMVGTGIQDGGAYSISGLTTLSFVGRGQWVNGSELENTWTPQAAASNTWIPQNTLASRSWTQ